MDMSLSKLGVGDGQGSLPCFSPRRCIESDMIEQLNWTELMGPDAMILVFWSLSFKPAFSLSSFALIKSLVSSSSLSSIRVVSSAYLETSLVAQTLKRLPTMWETQVQSLGQEDLPEKEMATHSSILARKIPRTEESVRQQSMGSQTVGHDWKTSISLSLSL